MKYLKKFEFNGVSQEEDEDLTTYEKVEKSIREYDEVEDIEERLKNFINDPGDNADIDKGIGDYDNDSIYKIVSESIIDNEWNMDVMDVLSKYGAKLNRNNRYGYTPLFNFAESEDEDLFEHFLEIGVKPLKDIFGNEIIPADIKHRDNAGGDVLHHYLNRYGKDLEFFKFIIEKGANVQNLTNNGDTLLFLSISSQKIFDYLLTIIDPNIINSEGKNALCNAKSYNIKRFMKLLLLTDDIDVADGYIFQNLYGDVKSYYKTYSFQNFIGEKHPHCFKYLIDNGIEIDSRIAKEYDYVISGGDMGLM